MAPDRFRGWTLAGVFGAGALAAFFLWNRIALPYVNPGGVIGLCSQLQFNPLNDFVRFAVFCFLPSLLLAGLCLVRPSFLKNETPKRVSSGPEPPAEGKEPVWKTGLLLAYAVVLALNVPTYHAFGRLDFFHEGESLGAAVSYLHGRVPYRDLLFYHGFFQDPLRCALAFKLFGRSIGAARALESLLKIAAWLFMALCLRGFFRGRIALAFGSLSVLALVYVSFIFSVFISTFLPLPSPEAVVAAFQRVRPYVSPFEFLIVPARDVTAYSFVLSLSGIHRFLNGKGKKAAFPFIPFFFFSFLPVASLAYAVDRGLFLCAAYALLAPLVYFAFFRGQPLERSFWTASFLGLAGAAAVLALAFQGGFFEFFHYVFGVMPFYKGLSEKIPLPIGQWNFLFLCCLISGHFYFWVYRFLNAGRLKVAFLREAFLETALLALSLAFFTGILERSDWEHAIYCAGVLYLLTLFVAAKWILAPSFGSPRVWKGTALGITALSVVLSALCLLRIVRLDMLEKNFPVGVEDGQMLSEGQNQTAAFLEGKIQKDGDFFTMTSEAGWYYLLDKACPTRFPYLWVAATGDYQREIVRDLEERKVQWVLYKDADWSYSMDGTSNEEKFPILSQYVRQHYQPYRVIDGNEIWILRPQGSPD